jgi:hypothetical protein
MDRIFLEPERSGRSRDSVRSVLVERPEASWIKHPFELPPFREGARSTPGKQKPSETFWTYVGDC